MTLGVPRDGFVLWLANNLGIPYNNGGSRLDDPPENHTTDCSGYIWRGLRHGGVALFPPVTSSAQAKWCYDAGLEISRQEFIDNPGTLAFCGPNRGLAGFGSNGHVMASKGGGQMFETPSAAGHQSGISPVARQPHISGYGAPPGAFIRGLDGKLYTVGVNTPSPNPQAPPPAPDPHNTPGVDWAALGKFLRAKAIEDVKRIPQDLGPGSMGPQVAVWQNAVNLAMDYALTLDGEFGSLTKSATKALQRRCGLRQDTIVGPRTRAGCEYLLAYHR